MAVKSKTKKKVLTMREELEKAPYFTERDYDLFVAAINNHDRVTACKQARAMLGVGLREALNFADKYHLYFKY